MTNDMVSAAYAQGRSDQRKAEEAAMRQALEALEFMEPYLATEVRARSLAITALRASLATGDNLSPTEPVAWMDREGDIYKMPEIKGWAPPHTMLYAASPERKPLTTEEAIALWAEKSDGPSNGEIVSFCRAIERAHGIK